MSAMLFYRNYRMNFTTIIPQRESLRLQNYTKKMTHANILLFFEKKCRITCDGIDKIDSGADAP